MMTDEKSAMLRAMVADLRQDLAQIKAHPLVPSVVQSAVTTSVDILDLIVEEIANGAC